MSDKTNVDNPNIVSSLASSKVDRWAWLKNIPNKILQKSSVPTQQIINPTEASREQLPDTDSPAPTKPSEEPELEKQKTEETVLDESISTMDDKESEKKSVSKRTLKIGLILQEELAGLAMGVPEIETRGVPAIIGTNETVGNGFFEAIQEKHPDGYLIGVGSGSALSMLHVFEEGEIPKGVILADIDPRVVATGRLLIQNLKGSKSVADFQRNFFDMTEETFNQQLRNMIDTEQDSALKRRWQTIDSEIWHKVWEDLLKREPLEWKDIRAYKYEGQNIDVVGAILARFDTLKQLADEDNITMAYADFTNPHFIGALKNLPDLENLTNVIYFSNIADHITHRGSQMENITALAFLKAYENPMQPAIFIDTLGQKLNYFLRARNSLAEFTEDDFPIRGFQSRSQKPERLLFADNARKS